MARYRIDDQDTGNTELLSSEALAKVQEGNIGDLVTGRNAAAAAEIGSGFLPGGQIIKNGVGVLAAGLGGSMDGEDAKSQYFTQNLYFISTVLKTEPDVLQEKVFNARTGEIDEKKRDAIMERAAKANKAVARDWDRLNSGVETAVGKFTAGTVGGALGAGATLAAVGTVVGPVGTVAGFLIGGLGSLAGGALGVGALDRVISSSEPDAARIGRDLHAKYKNMETVSEAQVLGAIIAGLPEKDGKFFEDRLEKITGDRAVETAFDLEKEGKRSGLRRLMHDPVVQAKLAAVLYLPYDGEQRLTARLTDEINVRGLDPTILIVPKMLTRFQDTMAVNETVPSELDDIRARMQGKISTDAPALAVNELPRKGGGREADFGLPA